MPLRIPLKKPRPLFRPGICLKQIRELNYFDCCVIKLFLCWIFRWQDIRGRYMRVRDSSFGYMHDHPGARQGKADYRRRDPLKGYRDIAEL